MDQELRVALRQLQRAGQSFAELRLEEFMDVESLNQLMLCALYAKFKLQNISFVSEPSAVIPGAGAGVKLKSLDSCEKPRISRVVLRNLGTHGVGKQVPQTFEEAPFSLGLKLFDLEVILKHYPADNLLGYYPSLAGVPMGTSIDKATFQYQIYGCNHRKSHLPSEFVAAPAVAAHQLMDFHLIATWAETVESFEKFREKRLRERGLLPGRKWTQ